MSTTLSVVIVLYNSDGVIVECLERIRADVDDGWAELILVDNASPDTSLASALSVLPSAKVVCLDSNLGFAGGANAGISAAAGRYVLLLNPDVQVPRGGLRELVAWMDENPSVAVASPRLVNGGGADGFPGRATPSVWRILLELSRTHKLLPQRVRGSILQGPYWTGGDQLDVGWVPGTAMLVRAWAIVAAGPLNEAFFMYGEDIEWCHRIRKRAGKVGVCSGVTVRHDWGSSSKLSWGERTAERRVIAGIAAACAAMYGHRRARMIAALNALAALMEACMPRRDPAQRRDGLELARSWGRCITARLDPGAVPAPNASD